MRLPDPITAGDAAADSQGSNTPLLTRLNRSLLLTLRLQPQHAAFLDATQFDRMGSNIAMRWGVRVMGELSSLAGIAASGGMYSLFIALDE